MKSSPFGMSILSSFYCLAGLSYGLLQSLFNLFKGDDEKLTHNYNFAINNYELLKAKGLLKINTPGALSIVKDPELKMRVIAMLDYYSQLALRPIHNYLLECLKRLPCDRTFTQDPRFTTGTGRPGDHYWSLDLSAATDRFPITIQKKVIAQIFGYEISNDWVNLLVNRVYSYGENNFKYEVGQPMGAYSS